MNESKKYYLADVEDLDSPARLLLERLHFEADKKRKFSTIPAREVENEYVPAYTLPILIRRGWGTHSD